MMMMMMMMMMITVVLVVVVIMLTYANKCRKCIVNVGLLWNIKPKTLVRELVNHIASPVLHGPPQGNLPGIDSC